MSVDSKVFVVADISKGSEIGNAVYLHLSSWYRTKFNEANKHLLNNNNFFWPIAEDCVKDTWSQFVELRSTSFGLYTMVFKIDGENRCLYYFLECSCDTDDITTKNTFSFMIGHWGKYQEIMQEVISVLKNYGDVYWDENDCDDLGYELQN
jgi:hypothetical protein